MNPIGEAVLALIKKDGGVRLDKIAERLSNLPKAKVLDEVRTLLKARILLLTTDWRVVLAPNVRDASDHQGRAQA